MCPFEGEGRRLSTMVFQSTRTHRRVQEAWQSKGKRCCTCSDGCSGSCANLKSLLFGTDGDISEPVAKDVMPLDERRELPH